MVSILIKALNEEAKIGLCIESAIAALSEIPNPSEIILADSLSSDRTIEIAKRYPIKIVQLEHAVDRGCGAGVQLGYQHSRGDLVMLLDGDMQLRPGFLPRALAKLSAEPRLAGVAGVIEETSIVNQFDRTRDTSGVNKPTTSARWLNGGGLYRRVAIAEAGGYAADRNLKGWEEAELGMRLRASGWSLERIDYPSTLHTGHAASTWQLIRSAWRSGRATANGVLIKQAAGKPWMLDAVALLLHPILVIMMWFGAVGALAASIVLNQWGIILAYLILIAGSVFLFGSYRKSLKYASTSFVLWHLMAAWLMLGLRERVVSPTEEISSIFLSGHQKN